LITCDTPLVAENVFDYTGPAWHQPAAIALNGCPLADVKNNSIKGYFYYAFSVYSCSDAVLSGNSSDKCYVGVYSVGATTFKGHRVREAGGGFALTSFTGTLEDCIFEKCAYGVGVSTATVQMTSCVYRDPPKDGHAIDFASGEVTLINCEFGPESVVLPKVLPKADKPFITAMHYLILKVNGEVPEDSEVEVRTANLKVAPGAADLNVRNSPAPLVGRRTPLPESLSPLILRAWVLDKDGKTVPAPEYSVRVLAPAQDGKERKILKTLTVKPDAKWFRPKPNDPVPTLEVSLK